MSIPALNSFPGAGKETDMRQFRTPSEIQQFLNKLKYRIEGGARSPLIVEKTRLANCFDGAVYAAAALETLGHPPLIVDLVAKNDDDHVIAVYRCGGWGAVAKSNTTLLRSRAPVYRSLRELVMSYFDSYFNTHGHKSLRSYSAPVNLCSVRRDLVEDNGAAAGAGTGLALPYPALPAHDAVHGARTGQGRAGYDARMLSFFRPARVIQTKTILTDFCIYFRCGLRGKPLLCTLF